MTRGVPSIVQQHVGVQVERAPSTSDAGEGWVRQGRLVSVFTVRPAETADQKTMPHRRVAPETSSISKTTVAGRVWSIFVDVTRTGAMVPEVIGGTTVSAFSERIATTTARPVGS